MNNFFITIIAIVFSLALHFFIFYIPNEIKEEKNFIKNKSEIPNEVKVTFNTIKPKPIKANPKIELKQKIKPAPKSKKVVKNEIIKIQKLKPKPKKKQKSKLKPKIKEKIIKEIVIKNINKKQKPKIIQQKQVKQSSIKQKLINKDLIKKKYFKNIKIKINQNKIYPKRAIIRGQEGKVQVKFVVSKNGELISIKILKGKKIFYKSVKKAINNSFPIILKDNLFTKNLIFKITLVYKLY